MTEQLLLNVLQRIESKLDAQNLYTKPILTFKEACQFLDLSQSHLYKLTSGKQIPHYCPNGKRLYFKRAELENWLQQNRQPTMSEMMELTVAHMNKNRR